MSPETVTVLAGLFLVVGVALIGLPFPSWAHWTGVGFCVLSIYCGWQR